MNITGTAPQEMEEAEHAYQAAAVGFTLFSEPLAPYSYTRKFAAQSLGMLYPLIGEEGAAQLERTGVYAGALKDAAILLWLCTLKDASDLTRDDLRAGEWTPARASIKPAEALAVAMEWADNQRLTDMSGARFAEAWQVFTAISMGVAASEFVLEVPGAPTPPEDASPNVKRGGRQPASTRRPSAK